MHQGSQAQRVRECLEQMNVQDAESWGGAHPTRWHVILKAWRILDHTSDDEVTRESFEVFFTQLLQQLGMKNSRELEETVQQALSVMDKNQDGVISLEKFRNFVKSGNITRVAWTTLVASSQSTFLHDCRYVLQIFWRSGTSWYVDWEEAKRVIKIILDQKGGFDKFREELGCSTSFDHFIHHGRATLRYAGLAEGCGW